MEECRPLDLVIPVLGAGTGNISGKVITQEQFAPSMEECRPLYLVIPVLGACTGNISGKHNKLLSVETLSTSELAQNEEYTKMFILCVNHILLWERKWCHCISYHDLSWNACGVFNSQKNTRARGKGSHWNDGLYVEMRYDIMGGGLMHVWCLV